jgi:hypothetical protein
VIGDSQNLVFNGTYLALPEYPELPVGITHTERRSFRRGPSENQAYASGHPFEVVYPACAFAEWRRQVDDDGRYYDLG